MSPRKTLNYYLMKINRAFVWALLLFIILLTVTGYGLTKPALIESLTDGILNYQTPYICTHYWTFHSSFFFYYL